MQLRIRATIKRDWKDLNPDVASPTAGSCDGEDRGDVGGETRVEAIRSDASDVQWCEGVRRVRLGAGAAQRLRADCVFCIRGDDLGDRER
jgi:hypothetical protein